MGMTTNEAIEILRTESVEIGGNAVKVARFLTALSMAVSALTEQQHDDGKCHYKGECGHKAPLTNADRIRAMSDEELAEFLSSIAYGREMPWSKPFQKKICNNCPTTTCTVEGYDHPMELNECDFADGECPHGSNITWWLQQPCEEGE